MTLALCKIFSEMGYSVSPFKAQNMSNNSAVCDDGSEIGRAQYLQAASIPIETTYHLNPVLLKPQGGGVSQLVLNGRSNRQIHAKDYYREIDTLKPHVINSFEHLKSQYDLVIAEGAGSPVELNLTHRDLSNTFVADHFDTRIVLVADIERGGVFASIYGTYNLLSDKLKENVVGVIINKFRGDISLFDSGIEIIERDFSIPVLGIVPFAPLNIDMEDSLSIRNYQQNKEKAKIKVALIQWPHISNYNDIDPLIVDQEIFVDFIQSYHPLRDYDLILLPGTKMTITDLKWLKETGLFNEIDRVISIGKTALFGICGGYQMMFDVLKDHEGIENDEKTTEKGFGLIPSEITYSRTKKLKRSIYSLFGHELKAYEIHCGQCKNYELGYQKGQVQGSHLHGLFENDSFRREYFKGIRSDYLGYESYQKHKSQQINKLTRSIKEHINIDLILSSLKE